MQEGVCKKRLSVSLSTCSSTQKAELACAEVASLLQELGLLCA